MFFNKFYLILLIIMNKQYILQTVMRFDQLLVHVLKKNRLLNLVSGVESQNNYDKETI